jgi:hypothetical protein
MRLPILAVLPAIALAAIPARADTLVLKNGRSLEGQVTEAGDTVVFERSGIRMEIRKDEVQEIRKAVSPKEEYAKRAAAREEIEKVKEYVEKCGTEAAEEHHRLGLWCEQKGLKAEAKSEQERAVALCPDHEGARRALGFVKDGGKWRPEEDVMTERGLVRSAGRWVAPEEAAKAGAGDALSPKEKDRREAKEWERRLRKDLAVALKAIASPDAAARAEGEKALVAVAREMNDPAFEAKAPELHAYYDRLYEEMDSARAVIQVRAQVVTLKRPIPKFTTSLGAFSSPVTLQLPELSVISVNTTAVVPLGLGDDE